MIHIVAGDVGEPTALMADALPLIEADEHELAVGACVAAVAAVLTGGHLIEASTRRAIASGTRAVLARCDLPDPIAQVVAGVGTRVDRATCRRGPDAPRCRHHSRPRPSRASRRSPGRHVHVVYFDTCWRPLRSSTIGPGTIWPMRGRGSRVERARSWRCLSR